MDKKESATSQSAVRRRRPAAERGSTASAAPTASDTAAAPTANDTAAKAAQRQRQRQLKRRLADDDSSQAKPLQPRDAAAARARWWRELRYELLRAVAILVVFTVLHHVALQPLLNRFNGFADTQLLGEDEMRAMHEGHLPHSLRNKL